jgi:hypothetical protein
MGLPPALIAVTEGFWGKEFEPVEERDPPPLPQEIRKKRGVEKRRGWMVAWKILQAAFIMAR